jgi:hypothetical protein
MHLFLPHSCYMLRPSQPSWLDHWKGLEVMKLLIMQLSPASSRSIRMRSKYSPQHPVFKHPHNNIW